MTDTKARIGRISQGGQKDTPAEDRVAALGDFDLTGAAWMLVSAVCYGIPGLVLLVASRDSGAIDQLGIGRELRRSRSRGLGLGMLIAAGR